MSAVRVENVHKLYATSGGQTHAVRGVTLDCHEGEILAVLGPSGCGKSSLMRMIAGLEHISAGEIRIGGMAVSSLPPEERNVSLAFENYALYPTMTVRQNLEFPLKNLGKYSTGEIATLVSEIAALFHLSQVLDRIPAELSGGHQQMVSLGRALIKPASLHILDEPLSHLDLRLRNEVVARLKTLQRERQLTIILITHDQAEALELADRVAVMNDGRLQQVGSPGDIVERPATLFVADFVGEPPMNLIPCRCRSDSHPQLETAGGTRIDLPAAMQGAPEGADLLLGVRPADLFIATGTSEKHTLGGKLSPVQHEQLGEVSIQTFEFEGCPLRVLQRRREGARNGGTYMRIGYRPDKLHLFDKNTGLRVGGHTAPAATPIRH